MTVEAKPTPKPTLAVQFRVRPACMADFLAIVRPHAAGTLALCDL